MVINYKSDRFREKYTHQQLRRSRPLSRAQRERFESKEDVLSINELLKKIQNEKHPDRLKKLLKKVPKKHTSKQIEEEKLRLQKLMLARKNMQKCIKKFANQSQSAERTKVSMLKLQQGKTKEGLKAMGNMATYGEFGSKHTLLAEEFTKAVGELKKQTSGEIFKSMLSQMLKQASTPLTSYEQIKDIDGKDKNLEGRQTEDSNKQQMAKIQINRLKGSVTR